MNKDVDYQVTNDQMQFIVIDSQAPQARTAGWLVDIDPVTTSYKELPAIISGFKPIFI